MNADLNATFCATLVDEWIRSGVTDAVVSPGSRSTPIVLALAARTEVRLHVHLDERSAGFVALGLALASGRPAVVVTTSGTAAVELHPAIVEAHLSCVPLIAATADRPPELQDVGAPQTIDQTHLYGRSVRWFAEPGPPTSATMPVWRSLAARSVIEANGSRAGDGPGPVHLNLAFREPLVGSVSELPPARPDGAPWHGAAASLAVPDAATTDAVVDALASARGLIVAGAGCGPAADVAALSAVTGWPVVADPRSGCRRGSGGSVAHADAILRHVGFAAEMRPEVVLRLGQPPASKVLATWLAGCDAVQVAVSSDGWWRDPEGIAMLSIRADASALLWTLTGALGHVRSADWGERWAAAEAAASASVDRFLDECEVLSEPGAARAVCASAPEGSTIVVSSSMPIRDLEWFGGPTVARVLANRGANGIDGVTSTALGAALAARGTGAATIAFVGDVAFLHDTNALVGIAGRGVDLTVVVVDNDGGGIFSFLPQADLLGRQRFEQLFGTPHGVDLAGLAAAHSVECSTVDSAASLTAALDGSIASGGVRIIRVAGDRAENVKVHAALQAAVAEAVEAVEADMGPFGGEGRV